MKSRFKLEDNSGPWSRPSTISKGRTAPSGGNVAQPWISNILTGVKDGYERKLEYSTASVRAAICAGPQFYQLALGFRPRCRLSAAGRPVQHQSVPSRRRSVITGIDKQVLGQVASEIPRLSRP